MSFNEAAESLFECCCLFVRYAREDEEQGDEASADSWLHLASNLLDCLEKSGI